MFILSVVSGRFTTNIFHAPARYITIYTNSRCAILSLTRRHTQTQLARTTEGVGCTAMMIRPPEKPEGLDPQRWLSVGAADWQYVSKDYPP